MTRARTPASPLGRHRTMHGQVVEWLGLRIVSGELPGGSQLPNEAELAATLQVSRGGVREAVKALAAKGLVEPRPRLGTRVLPRAEWNLMDREVIDWHSRAGDADFLSHLLELRLVVEPGAAAFAATRATEAQLLALQSAYDGMAEHADDLPDSEEEFVRADLAFHLTLLQSSGNQLIEQLGRLLETGLRHSLEVLSHPSSSVQETLPLHRAVLLAVRGRREAAAFRAMRKLIETTATAAERARKP